MPTAPSSSSSNPPCARPRWTVPQAHDHRPRRQAAHEAPGWRRRRIHAARPPGRAARAIPGAVPPGEARCGTGRATEGPIEPREKPKRDWLALDPVTKTDAAAGSEQDEPAALPHVRAEAPERRWHQHDARDASDAPRASAWVQRPDAGRSAIPIVAEHERMSSAT